MERGSQTNGRSDTFRRTVAAIRDSTNHYRATSEIALYRHEAQKTGQK